MPDTRKCKHILDDGTQCKAWALIDKDLCFSHDPESKEAKAIAVRNGGLVRPIRIDTPLETVEVNTPKDVITLLGKTINEVRTGILLPQIANTIGFLASHLLRAFEVAEIEDKVEEVKAVLIQRKTISSMIDKAKRR